MVDKSINLTPLLKKIAAENNFKTCNIKVTPTSTGGANFTSLLYRATISGDGRDDLRLFVKLAANGEKMREQCNGDLYANERFIYTKLMVAYKQLEDRHNVPEEHRLRFPKYYGADATYLYELLVLEDLSCQGFALHDRMKSVDWEYASAAITQLAKYHALCFTYEHEYPEEFKKVFQKWNNDALFNEIEGFYETLVNTSLAAVREENKHLLKTFLDRYDMTDFEKYFKTNRRAVLLHGDFRPSNILYKSRNDGTVELIPVDYQTPRFGSPISDLLYFIFTATDGSARAQYYDKLVSHYHSELDNALHRLGLRAQDVYPEEEFRMELKEKLPFGLLLSSMMLPCMLVAEEDAPKIDSELNLASFAVTKTGDLHKTRLNEVVDDYIAWGILV